MPKYSSKTQSKNGGRRRKQTKRKLRRGKSRKVMMGGTPLSDAIMAADANDILIQYGLAPTSPVSAIKSSPSYDLIKKRLLTKNIDIEDAKYNSS